MLSLLQQFIEKECGKWVTVILTVLKNKQTTTKKLDVLCFDTNSLITSEKIFHVLDRNVHN